MSRIADEYEKEESIFKDEEGEKENLMNEDLMDYEDGEPEFEDEEEKGEHLECIGEKIYQNL